MNFRKIVGWLLLIAGLLIIGWTLYSTYNVFSAKVEAPQVFSLEKGMEKESSIPQKGKVLDAQKEIESMMSKQMEERLGKLLPKDTIPKLLNLMSWSIMAGILIFGGGQISGLGIKLIRD